MISKPIPTEGLTATESVMKLVRRYACTYADFRARKDDWDRTHVDKEEAEIIAALDAANATSDRLRDALANLVLIDSNSRACGVQGYQKGSQMWQAWEAARKALEAK